MNANFNAVKNAIDDNQQQLTTNQANIQLNTDKLSALDAKLSTSSSCPTGMAQVGAICVDIYEASIVDNSGNAMTSVEAANAGCKTTGNGCKGVIFAKSVKEAAPAVEFNWFQANLACMNSGKRLLTNAEWQAAATGTVDPGDINSGNNMCNTGSTSFRLTGHAGSLADQENSCVSDWGIEDMIGNVNEFVSDWMPGNTPIGSNQLHGATHGNDRAKVVSIGGNEEDGSRFPAVVIRGGSTGASGQGIFSFDAFRQPTITLPDLGFRCALPL
jgi:formylglycine-generating enzyme required for sulfatase activity